MTDIELIGKDTHSYLIRFTYCSSNSSNIWIKSTILLDKNTLSKLFLFLLVLMDFGHETLN